MQYTYKTNQKCVLLYNHNEHSLVIFLHVAKEEWIPYEMGCYQKDIYLIHPQQYNAHTKLIYNRDSNIQQMGLA